MKLLTGRSIAYYSKQQSWLGIWRRRAHGRRWDAEPSPSNGRQCQFLSKLKRVTACNASGSFVRGFLFPVEIILSFPSILTSCSLLDSFLKITIAATCSLSPSVF